MSKLNTLKKGTNEWYSEAYEEMTFDKDFENAITAAANKVLSGVSRYKSVAGVTSVPWWVIGVIHYKEATCDFRGVLHNGEKIIGTGRKTTIVPIGKGPFSTWEEAAVDALKHDGVPKNKDWSVGNTLRLLEAYNGLGYLRYHPEENSPYLWAMSSINDDYGKYVSDGKYDPKAYTNKTTGAAVILKELERLGYVYLGSETAPAPARPIFNAAHVSELQTYLNLLECEPYLVVDGRVGTKTKQALLDLAAKI